MQDHKNACTDFHMLLTSDYNWIYFKKSLTLKSCKNFAELIGEYCPAELDIFLAYYALEVGALEHIHHTIQGGWTTIQMRY